MRYVLILVGALTIGCAQTVEQRVTMTPAARMAWLEAELARSEPFVNAVRGAYLPRGGAEMVCSMAIQIDAWYGVSDERWELTHAKAFADAIAASSSMLPARSTRNIREELTRIGVRDCVLDMNR